MARKKIKTASREDLPEQLADIHDVRLVGLLVRNVLRIRALRMSITRTGEIVRFEGDNKTGKSSTLKSIEMLAAGADAIPPEPIHDDLGRGEIIGRLASSIGTLVVTRRFDRGKKTSQLTVHIEGQRKALSSPQTVMTALFGDSTQFQNMGPEMQRQVLAEIVGFNPSMIDKRASEVFEERRVINRDVARLKAEYDATKHYDDAPEKEVSVAEMMRELKLRQEHNAEGAKLEQLHSVAANMLTQKEKELEDLLARVEELKAKVEHARESKAESLKALASFEPQDEEELRKTIEDADSLNAKVRENQKRAQKSAEYTKAQEKSESMTSELDQLAAKKRKMLAEAASKMPVDGLGFNEEGLITFDGKPFSQAGNSAEKLVSCAVTMELNKDKPMKVLLVDDAEGMDRKTKRKLAELCEKKGFQLFMAQVMSDAGPSDGALVIEDGELKGKWDAESKSFVSASDEPAPEEVDDSDLAGRTARCSYYGSTPTGNNHAGPCGRGKPCMCTEPSSRKLAFFQHQPDKEHDSYYCGCWGWE